MASLAECGKCFEACVVTLTYIFRCSG